MKHYCFVEYQISLISYRKKTKFAGFCMQLLYRMDSKIEYKIIQTFDMMLLKMKWLQPF